MSEQTTVYPMTSDNTPPPVNPFKTVSTAHRVTQSRRIGAEQPGQYNTVFHMTYCSVGAAWRASFGCVEGWQFYRAQGGAPDAVTFDHPDAWRIDVLLDFWHPANKNDSQKGQFVIFWHKLGKALDAARIVAVLDMAHDLDYWPAYDTNDYPKEDAMPGLPPLPDKLTVRARMNEPKRAAWIDDPDLLVKFHERWNTIYNERVAKAGAPAGKATEYRHNWQKKNIDSEHLKESTWNNTAQALLKALTGSLDFDYPLPAEPKTENAPISNDKADSRDEGETISAGSKPAISEPQSEPKTTKDKPVADDNGVIDLKAQIRERYNKPQRGNDYLVVQGRVLLFRLEHPDWTVETDAVLMTDTAAVFKATIRNQEGRVIATGHGKATEAGTKNLSGRYIEKAETSAIGRALALAGFGTDDSLDDSDYLADSPVEKKAS